MIATIFRIESFNTVGRMINIARDCLNRDLVSKYIGLKNFTRNDIINRNTVIYKTIFNSHDKPITIWDGTYAYCQKSLNYFVQKKLCSGQKKRALVKPFRHLNAIRFQIEFFGKMSYCSVLIPYHSLHLLIYSNL